MSGKTLQSFSISHAAILTAEVPFEQALKYSGASANGVDLYGIKEGNVEVDMGEFDNEGDDRVLDVWYWINYANVTVTMGYVPFKVLSKIQGTTSDKTLTGAGDNVTVPKDSSIESSATGDLLLQRGLRYGTNPGSVTSAADLHSVPLWTQKSLNQPTFPMVLTLPSKDASGSLRDVHIGLYRVQFKPFSFQGPAYKEGLMLNYSGKALMADTDEQGNKLAEDAIGRIISVPSGWQLDPALISPGG